MKRITNLVPYVIALACLCALPFVFIMCSGHDAPRTNAVTRVSDLDVTATSTFAGTMQINANPIIAGGTGSNRLLLRGNTGASIRWQSAAGVNRWGMFDDWLGTATPVFGLFDSTNSRTSLLIDNRTSGASGSFLNFGPASLTSGGIDWDPATKRTCLYTNSIDTLCVRRIATTGATWTESWYQLYFRPLLGAPTLSADCNGSSAATLLADSSDSRGKITLGTNAAACTLTFQVPWDVDGVGTGDVTCTANASTAGVSIAITSLSDHAITFTPSAAGATTITYFCDGMSP